MDSVWSPSVVEDIWKYLEGFTSWLLRYQVTTGAAVGEEQFLLESSCVQPQALQKQRVRKKGGGGGGRDGAESIATQRIRGGGGEGVTELKALQNRK